MTNKNLTKARKILSPDKTHDLSLIFTALSDVNRLKIVGVITKYPDICVTDMARILKISTPAVSQHFKILELSGLVVRLRRGRMICYKLNKKNKMAERVLSLVIG